MALNKVAKQWVKALRSGKIKQTKDKLGRESGSRCCLGVLCDLAVNAKVIESYNIGGGTPPQEVIEWAGLSTKYGSYTTKQDKNRDLTEDNDTYKKSFAKIADIIESQPEGLFV
jgi:hypothetical protein